MMNLPYFVSVLLFFAGFSALALFVEWMRKNELARKEATGRFRAVLAGAVLSGIVLVFGTASFGVTFGTDVQAMRDAHLVILEDTREWLSDDYGITVDADNAEKLMRGRELVVDIDGVDTLVEIVEHADGSNALRELGGRLLTPAVSK